MASIFEPVYLGVRSDREIGTLLEAVLATAPRNLRESLVLVSRLRGLASQPDDRNTWDRWQVLATVASDDLAAARAIEPHVDARAILTEAGTSPAALWPTDSPTLWGVFASEPGDDPAIATRENGRMHLSGRKQWCSLAPTLDPALVIARTSDGSRQLFAMNLRHDAALPIPGEWSARGGIAVAACWFGSAVGLARTLFEAARESKAEPVHLMRLGVVDALLERSRRSLAKAAQQIDSQAHDRDAAGVLALRVRSTVAAACEEIICHTGHALGPAPLALTEKPAKKVADLELYLRQHHAERDDASPGGTLSRQGDYPW